MAYNFQPIALMGGEQFDPIESLGRSAQLQGAYQQNQIRQMQLAEMVRQAQQANAQRQAAGQAATYAPQQTVNSPSITLGGIGNGFMPGESAGMPTEVWRSMGIPVGGPQQLTLPDKATQVQGPAGADFRNQYLSGLGKTAPELIPGAQSEFAAQDAAKQQAAIAQQEQSLKLQQMIAGMDKSKREVFGEATESVGRAAATVKSAAPQMKPQVYAAAMQALSNDPNPITRQMAQQFPPQYSPELDPKIEQAYGQAVSVSELVKSHQAPKADDRAREIYSKPATSWSPEEKAFIKGYEKQVDVTKTQPGVARMEVLMNGRPVQAIDPNNPEQVVYMPAGKAMKSGAASPQSIGYQTDKGVQKAFTVGKPAEELVAFNTAIAHADLLEKAAKALGNGDTRSLNSMKNELKTQFGSADVTNFGVIANAYAREVNKALTAGHITDAEIKEAGATVPPNASPDQILGAVNAYRQLMASKVQQRKAQYDSGKQGKPNFGGAEQQADPLGIR